MSHRPPDPTLAERLLVESICRREEAAGNPAPAAEADANAVQSGGSFAARIRTRALGLPDSDVALHQIETALRVGRAAFALLILLAAIAGALAASIALDRADSVSLPLILFALVGFNLLMLALWVLMQALGGRGGAGLAGAWQFLARRFSAAAQPAGEAVRLIAQGPGSRWRFGAIVHAAWLAYALTGLVTLALLLILRRYELSWQTTLLDPEGLRRMAGWLSVAPRLLGAPGPEALALVEPFADADRRGWARWILLAVFAYGVLPRAIALLACLALLRPAYALNASALNRPGHARLRERLMPDRNSIGVVDPQRAPLAAPPRPDVSRHLLPSAPLHGIALEWPQAVPLPGERWARFEHIDDSASRDAAAQALRTDSVTGLVLVLRATATPDRGLARAAAGLIDAARAPAWIALGEFDALEARGAAVCARRLEDWRSLAAQAGAQSALLRWDITQGLLSPLQHGP